MCVPFQCSKINTFLGVEKTHTASCKHSRHLEYLHCFVQYNLVWRHASLTIEKRAV